MPAWCTPALRRSLRVHAVKLLSRVLLATAVLIVTLVGMVSVLMQHVMRLRHVVAQVLALKAQGFQLTSRARGATSESPHVNTGVSAIRPPEYDIV